MNRIPIRVEVKITLAAPFHVGGGKGGAGTCSYLLRNGSGTPYWPGSAFKGKVRHFARLLYESAKGRACAYEHSLADGGDVKNCKCPVCDMLGGAGNAKGSLLFGDMELQDATGQMRTGNAIDRHRRTAKDNSLFRIETAAGSQLVGEITGTLSEEDYEDQKDLLKAAIEAIPHIGGNTGRGLGWITPEGISADIQKLEQDELPAGLRDYPVTTLDVRITAESPLLIGTRTSESNFRATLPYIPGAVVHAALAQALVAQDGGGKEGAVNWVEPEGGRGQFSSLRRAFGELRITQFMPLDCRFAPMTAVCPKYESNQSFDTLLKEPEEDEHVERAKGFIDTEGALADPPRTMVVTKSAMNRFRGTSQDEMLFSMEVMTPPVVFEGTVSGAFDPAELERLTENGIRVGGYQTAGCGRCAFEVTGTCGDRDTKEKLRERIRACGEKIPVTLRSDAIVCLDPPEDISNNGYLQTYQSALFSSLPGVKLTKAVAQHSQWRGFDTSKRKGYRKEPTHIIKAGAVFLLEGKVTPELLDALLELQAEGICQNDRHNRNGYGQICIADEIHFRGRK